jgi:polysaccharide pyruvyl transferase CsaB
VDATARGDIGAVRRAIARADAIVSGGGGLLQNTTSLRSLLYYAGIVRFGIRAGKKTMVFAQSIGPLDFWGKIIVREFCRGLSAATVRDERSRTLLSSLVPATAVERTADPVFLLEPATDVDLRIEGLGPESDPLAIVSVRRWPNGEATASAVAAAVDRLAERHGVRTAFLPLGGAADAEASTAVIRRCTSAPTLLPSCDLPHAAQIIARAKIVIGMRLHALILAARFGVPFLAVPYDPKVISLCDDLAYPLPPLWEAGNRSTPDLEAIRALVDRAWTERDALAAHLRDATVRMQALAAKNFETLGELLEH